MICDNKKNFFIRFIPKAKDKSAHIYYVREKFIISAQSMNYHKQRQKKVLFFVYKKQTFNDMMIRAIYIGACSQCFLLTVSKWNEKEIVHFQYVFYTRTVSTHALRCGNKVDFF